MVNQDIINYLLEGKGRGFEISLLKQKLLEGGFSEKDVEDAISYINITKQEINENKYEEKNNGLNFTGKKEENLEPLKAGLFWKIGKSISGPNELFEKTKNEGVFSPLKYLWFISLLPFLIISIIVFIFVVELSSYILENLSQYLSPEQSINQLLTEASYSFAGLTASVIFVFFFIIMPLILFIYSGILHLIVKVYKGKGNYAGTFKAIVYGATPSVLLSFVPIVNIVLGIWSFIISIFGFSINHEISKLKAFLAMITLPLLGLIITLIVLLVSMIAA